MQGLPFVSEGSSTHKALASVTSTLSSQSLALATLAEQYRSDVYSQLNLIQSLQILYNTSQVNRGKVVVCGIGKSYKIASKLVATMNSLSIFSSALHPADALHGDLGLIDESKDCLVLLTASGNTPELLQLLPHISPEVPVVLLTCNNDSKLSNHPQVNSLLYAALPAHLNEDSIHGLPAPTVSATLSLVLADATILALLELIEEDTSKRKKLFSIKHPGGSIGADLSHLNNNVAMSKSASTNSDKKSFSSHISTASLLSLDQIRKELHTTGGPSPGSIKSSLSSLNSSDDEGELFAVKAPAAFSISERAKANSELSSLILAADKRQVLKTTLLEVKLLNSSQSELKILQWTSLYEYIIFDSNVKKMGIRTSDIRQLYKTLHEQRSTTFGMNSGLWPKFNSSLLNAFTEVVLV
ncbi:SIS domain-containing protein [Suhomyces tanzawaensis NRRL Y-17324]|uniref:SIS domain-containing protein n=1 Tax=Suhomyces tanzawaensis NRRL Y-17324 TaxID=984487 RepID=A0A1E4SBT0_9ASCO|nr:SIS domain-containing protein [Suhomyces tanzawaensis NRRL Y-17324]ODV76977.1 SIS domain-containing protein [Suhomyces tanzawaensis NRRL Y-17324]